VDKDVVVMLLEGEVLFGEEQICSVLCAFGFTVKTVKMLSVETAIALEKPALMIANLSGARPVDLDDCIRLAQWSTAPLIAIGPAGQDAFRTAILEAGADDYLSRPVNPYELAARVKNIILRTHLPDQDHSKVRNPVGASNSTTTTATEWVRMRRFREWLCRIFKRRKV
jgi:DNA-binding response OmpR family regulator